MLHMSPTSDSQARQQFYRRFPGLATSAANVKVCLPESVNKSKLRRYRSPTAREPLYKEVIGSSLKNRTFTELFPKELPKRSTQVSDSKEVQNGRKPGLVSKNNRNVLENSTVASNPNRKFSSISASGVATSVPRPPSHVSGLRPSGHSTSSPNDDTGMPRKNRNPFMRSRSESDIQTMLPISTNVNPFFKTAVKKTASSRSQSTSATQAVSTFSKPLFNTLKSTPKKCGTQSENQRLTSNSYSKKFTPVRNVDNILMNERFLVSNKYLTDTKSVRQTVASTLRARINKKLS